jgi:hypothetical protein
MAVKRKPTKKPSADQLVKPAKAEAVELKEDELKNVSGGLIGLLNKQT